MELKKSYKGLVVWLMLLLGSMLALAFIPVTDEALMIRILLNVCTLELTLLTYIIYKTGYVYWFTGVNYEDAVAVGEERRKLYALKHLNVFGKFSLLLLGYSLLAHVLGFYFWIDIILMGVGVVSVAISTMKFEL